MVRQFCCFSTLAKEYQTDHLLQNRMRLCLVAICIMWATSLQVSTFISSSFIQIPQLDAILSSCQAGLSVVRNEKTLFDSCVDAQIDSCSDQLERAIDRETLRINKTSTLNQELVELTTDIQQSCSLAFTSLKLALESWVGYGEILPYRSNATCSADEIGQLANSFGSIESVKSEAFSLSSQYRLESTLAVDKISGYAMERFNYDAEYIDNQTKLFQKDLDEYRSTVTIPEIDLSEIFHNISTNIEIVVACVSVHNSSVGGNCSLDMGVRDMLHDVRSRADIEIQNYKDYIDEYINKVEELKNNIEDAFQMTSTFYTGVKEAIEELSITTTDWPAWYHVSLEDFRPPDVEFPTVNTSQYDPLSYDEIWDRVSPVMTTFENNLTLATTDAAHRINSLQDMMNDALNNMPRAVPQSYNPPRYVGTKGDMHSIDEERFGHTEKSEAFITRSTIVLEALSDFKDKDTSTADSFEPLLVNSSDLTNKFSNISISFEELQAASFDFNIWLFNLEMMGDVLYYLDLAFRVHQSLRLINKYWSANGIGMPTIDTRAYMPATNPFKMSVGKLVAVLITHPSINMVLFVLFGVWGFSTIRSIYAPLYKEYVSGCVPLNGQGTFITSNLFSLAYNHAYQDGSEKLMKGTESFERNRNRECTSSFFTSMASHNEHHGIFSTVSNLHTTTFTEMATFKKCYDIDTVDGQFEDACCGDMGYPQCTSEDPSGFTCPQNTLMNTGEPFMPPGNYLNEGSCQTEMHGKDWNLEDEIFRCDVLPACDITCNGPHRPKIESVTRQCGCTFEWYLHSAWLQSMLTFLIYLLMNASRMTLFEGLSRIFCKKLHPGYMTVLSTCGHEGELIHADASREAEEGRSEASKRKKYVERTIRNFQRLGVLMAICSILINIIWVYLLQKVKNSTKPEWYF
mmetsp:Transcript_3359/g.6107  ORF Transcript_3359/g.6107 Transcript_3359/m.6107 type:complete len:913 (-) Transcript_3359:38-2776(-)